MGRDNTRVPSEEDLLRKRLHEWQTIAGEFSAKISELEADARLASDQIRQRDEELARARGAAAGKLDLAAQLAAMRATAEDFATEVHELRSENNDLKTQVSNVQAVSDLWRQDRGYWKQIADNWKNNYYRVNEELTDLRRQVDNTPKPGSTVNLTVNVDTEDALAKLNELLEVANKIEQANNPWRWNWASAPAVVRSDQ